MIVYITFGSIFGGNDLRLIHKSHHIARHSLSISLNISYFTSLQPSPTNFFVISLIIICFIHYYLSIWILFESTFVKLFVQWNSRMKFFLHVCVWSSIKIMMMMNGLQCKLYMCLGINLMKIDITVDALESVS